MSIQQTISQLANQCVLCGLCLPHCPTYQVFHTENESPRGRINLLKALAENHLEADKALTNSISHCLSCLACEKMCPSQVEYSRINHLGRQLIVTNTNQIISQQQTWRQRLSEKILLTPKLHPLIKTGVKVIQPLIKPFLRRQSLIKTFSDELLLSNNKRSIASQNTQTETNTTTKQRKHVLLFKGCSGDLFEQQTILDTIKLLKACQYEVHIPENQSCCGAIKLRHGEHQAMQYQAQKNIELFSPFFSSHSHSKTNNKSYDAIISLNNSCSGQLKEYNNLSFSSHKSSQSSSQPSELNKDSKLFSDKVYDLISFLHQQFKTAPLNFSPLEQEVAIHTPCSLKNVLLEENLLYELLGLIPGIKLKYINSQYCCGAAGSYMLQYPEVSKQLLDDKLVDIKQHDYRLIISSNIGCSLHFKHGLNQSEFENEVEVIHPVSLLARQLII